MLRLILNFVLALAFLSNGFANASGQRAHANRQACHHETAGMDHAAMGHALHHDEMDMGDKAPAKPGNCCGAVVCKCGCTLPTVVVAPAFAVFPQSKSNAPSVALVAHAVIRRSTAPFRPPSV